MLITSRYIVADRIRLAAARRKLGTNRLADKAGVSRSQLYDVLACKKSTTTDWLDCVADALKVRTAWLLTPMPKRRRKK